jgi:transcriptional regulator with XRE-family HTH domain
MAHLAGGQSDRRDPDVEALSLAGVPAGRRLRLRRVRVGLSQARVATLAGVSTSLVSDVERDPPPRYRPAGQLAAAAAKVDAALRTREARWRGGPGAATVGPKGGGESDGR